MAFTRAVVCSSLVLAAVVTSIGCSDDDDEPIEHSQACSTGPARAGFDPPQGNASRRDLPSCVPRCGETTVSGPFPWAYALSGIPSGACVATDRCQMPVSFGTRTCDGVTTGCDLSSVECTCTAGEWQCVTTSYGSGGGCWPACHADDGLHFGADAGIDRG